MGRGFTMLKQTFDTVAHAMYLQVSEAPVMSTVEVTSRIYIDLDEDGRPVGAELLGVESQSPFTIPQALLDALETYDFPMEARLAMGDAKSIGGRRAVTSDHAQLLDA
jgi:uncharacterized protein YuzE